MDNYNIRVRIRGLRESKRISQTEFAEMLGVCRSSVINLETTSRIVNPRLAEVARILNTTEEYLLFGNEPSEQTLRFDANSEERLKIQRKELVDEYEKRLEEMRRQIQELGVVCKEQRDHINTLKQLNQRLEMDAKND